MLHKQAHHTTAQVFNFCAQQTFLVIKDFSQKGNRSSCFSIIPVVQDLTSPLITICLETIDENSTLG